METEYISKFSKFFLIVKDNMKIITSIYLRCRPELQDDWVSPVEVDVNIEESLVCFKFTFLKINIIRNVHFVY